MGQPHDHQNHEFEFIVLEVRRYGEPPIEVEVPANATGKYAAELVSQRIGIEGSVSLSLLPPKGRPTSTTLVARRSSVARAGQSSLDQEPPHRGAGQDHSFPVNSSSIFPSNNRPPWRHGR